MKFLYKYERVLASFIDFLKANNYPAKEILTKDLTHSLGYILEYLDTQCVYCLVDNYNMLVFTTGGTTNTLNKIKENKLFIIKETDNDKEVGIIQNYEYAITYAFEFLEVPF